MGGKKEVDFPIGKVQVILMESIEMFKECRTKIYCSNLLSHPLGHIELLLLLSTIHMAVNNSSIEVTDRVQINETFCFELVLVAPNYVI